MEIFIESYKLIILNSLNLINLFLGDTFKINYLHFHKFSQIYLRFIQGINRLASPWSTRTGDTSLYALGSCRRLNILRFPWKFSVQWGFKQVKDKLNNRVFCWLKRTEKFQTFSSVHGHPILWANNRKIIKIEAKKNIAFWQKQQAEGIRHIIQSIQFGKKWKLDVIHGDFRCIWPIFSGLESQLFWRSIEYRCQNFYGVFQLKCATLHPSWP
jgi:hypothetical protein